MSIDLLDLLSAPFPQQALKQRVAGGGRSFTYVEGHTVIHRLNACLPDGWSFNVVSTDLKPWGQTSSGRPQYIMVAIVALTIPGLGQRSHVGVQVVSEGAGEDLFKGAVTDGLKKAATLFGVGLELYGPDYEAVDQETGEIVYPKNLNPSRPAQTGDHTRTPEQQQRQRQNQQRLGEDIPQASSAVLISEKQIAYLWALAGERGQDDTAVHEKILAIYDKTSVKELTRKEASEFIDWLKGLTVATEKPARQEPQKTLSMAGMPEEPAHIEDAWTR